MNEIVQEYKEIKGDYAYNSDMMSPDDERVAKLKKVINERLSAPDKTIIILYAELQSYRKLGKEFGLSHMTIRREVMRIKKIILDEYRKVRL